MKILLLTYKQIFEIFKSKISVMINIILAFLLPIKMLIVLVGLMIVLDTITGLWKAKKTKEKITSKKLSRVISKMVLYQVALITFFILDKFIFGELVGAFTSIPHLLTKVVAVFFVGVELISINENVNGIYGFNLFKMFRNMLSRAKEVRKDIDDVVEGDNSHEYPRYD